jgi:hypothetical protein
MLERSDRPRRFARRANTLIGGADWDTPAIDPGLDDQYEGRHMARNGVTEFCRTVSDVVTRK